MAGLDHYVGKLTTILVRIAGVSLVLVVALTVANMLFRVAGRPLLGTFEVVGWLTAIANGLALAFTHRSGGHVAIGIVVSRLPRRLAMSFEVGVAVLSAGLFGFAAWRLVGVANRLREVGTVSDALRLPYYPFVGVLAFGIAVLALSFLVEALVRLSSEKPREEEEAAAEPRQPARTSQP